MGHMRGNGCDKCAALKRGRKRRNSLEKILSQFKEAHGDLYDYSEVDYQGVDTYVIIRCIKHDWKFPQTPYKHTQGSGCKFCKAEALRVQHIKTFDEFKKDALKAHGNKFDYSKVDYKGTKKNIEIGCPTKAHGYFMQTPDHHINGIQGCPICAEEVRSLGYTIEHIKKENIKINGFLYVINAFNDDENFFKIGITTKSTSWRFREI